MQLLLARHRLSKRNLLLTAAGYIASGYILHCIVFGPSRRLQISIQTFIDIPVFVFDDDNDGLFLGQNDHLHDYLELDRIDDDFIVEETLSTASITTNKKLRAPSCPDLPVLRKNFTQVWLNHHPIIQAHNKSRAVSNETNSNAWECNEFDEDCERLMYRNPIYTNKNRPSGLRIVFLGDSITRYQSLSLIHYLHTGYWVDEDMKPNFLQEHSFHDWTEFFNYSTMYLNGPETFLCDCYRNYIGNANQRRIMDVSTNAENRYYRDSCRDNHITFLAKFGDIPFQGHWHPQHLPYQSIVHPSIVAYNVSAVSKPFLWKYTSWSDVIQNHVALLQPKPDIAVLNAGIWKNHGLNHSVLSKIRRALDHAGIVGVYRTSSKRARQQTTNLDRHDADGCRLLHYCMLSNWTGLLTPEHYWDRLHFKAHVNIRLNEQLLEIIHKIRKK
jgi:hypothetical protein